MRFVIVFERGSAGGAATEPADRQSRARPIPMGVPIPPGGAMMSGKSPHQNR
jgi:hypothetical protein